MTEGNLQRDGFCLLRGAVDPGLVQIMLDVCGRSFQDENLSVRARSSRGHVYAARNLIEAIPEVTSVWQNERLLNFLQEQLGDQFGLVRVLYFDKPPDRTWTLPWHKDTSIAVQDNRLQSSSFSRPTTKAGVPHVIACDRVLEQMLTLRIHLDPVTDENGPLRVIPDSHVSSESFGLGVNAAVAIHASSGDVLAMRPMLSHCSGPSAPTTRLHRRILHLEFSADYELPDGYRWHTFIRPELKLCT